MALPLRDRLPIRLRASGLAAADSGDAAREAHLSPLHPVTKGNHGDAHDPLHQVRGAAHSCGDAACGEEGAARPHPSRTLLIRRSWPRRSRQPPGLWSAKKPTVSPWCW